jgi:hypothetical protein
MPRLVSSSAPQARDVSTVGRGPAPAPAPAPDPGPGPIASTRSSGPSSRLSWGLALGLLSSLAACETKPNTQAELDYYSAMSPILEDNAQMAKDYQSLAAKIKKQDPEAADIGKMLDRQFIPAARALHDRADAVDPGNAALGDAHDLLTEAWDVRVTNFEAIHDAWKSQDLDAYKAAADASYANKTTEDRYFREINVALAPADVTLEAYP